MVSKPRAGERRRHLTRAKRELALALSLSAIPEALHKEPALQRLSCEAGRHDFEVVKVRGPGSAMLECVYCGLLRGSERRELQR